VPHQTKPGRRLQEGRGYATTTGSRLALADWLPSWGVTGVGMASTSDSWKGSLAAGRRRVRLLAGQRPRGQEPAGAAHDRQGRCGLAGQARRAGQVPAVAGAPRPIRQLRDLTRYRRALLHDRTRELQRLGKLLEDAQIKLSSVASDRFGVSGRAMLEALIQGERDPKVLAQLARRRLRAKLVALEEALCGFFTDHHAVILPMMLGNIDRHSQQIAAWTPPSSRRSPRSLGRWPSWMRSPGSAGSPPRS
jgi:transposase